MSSTLPALDLPPLRRDRRVHAWLVSLALSGMGDAAWMVALAWTATSVAGPAAAGLVLGVGFVPRAVVLLLGGALADRWDTRRTMVVSDLGRIVVLLAATAVVLSSGVTLGLLLVVAVVFGVVDALYLPASSTLPRQLVRPDDLGSTAALNQLGSRLSTLIGAPVGGAVVAVGGLQAVMLLDAASFAIIAVVVVTLLRPRFPLARSTGRSVLADLRAGFGYLRRTPHVRTLVLALSGLNLFVGPTTAVGLALRTHAQSWGAGSLGAFEACIGAGAAVGALAAVRWKPALPARTGLLLLVGQAAACAVVGVATRPLMVAAMLTIGVTAGLASAMCSGAYQRAVDGSYLGRTSSIIALGDNVLMPAAMTGYGALAAAAGLGLTAALTGAGFAALVLWSATRPGIDVAAAGAHSSISREGWKPSRVEATRDGSSR